jgi:hypothetical protein
MATDAANLMTRAAKQTDRGSQALGAASGADKAAGSDLIPAAVIARANARATSDIGNVPTLGRLRPAILVEHGRG